MAQFLRPDGNITQTSFTNGFANIDEATASDADFAYGANNTAAVLEVSLSNPSATPGSGTCTVRYRIAKTSNGTVDGSGSAVTVGAELYEGATLRQSNPPQSATGTWTEYSFTFAASSITDWTDLRLRFTTSASGGSPANRRGAAVSWAEVEVPDAALASYTLTAETGTFALAGDTVDLLAARKITAAKGDLALSGNVANLLEHPTDALWWDTFEGTTGNPALSTRTPPIIGAGVTSGTWQVPVGNFGINSAANELRESNFNAGNRAYTRALGVDEYDVEIDFATNWATNLATAGITVRASAAAVNSGYECGYDSFLDAWFIEDVFGGGGSITLAEGAPSAGTMRVEVRDASIKLYYNGVLKLTWNTPGNSGTGVHAGILGMNFSNTGSYRHAFTRYSITPAPAANNYTLTADVGAFTEAGIAANLLASRRVTASNGAFSLNGINVGLQEAHRLVASVGTFSETGNDASLIAARKLSSATGAFAINGINVGLREAHRLLASVGTFSLSGIAAELTKGKRLVASTGVFTETGVAASLVAARMLLSTSGSFSLNGINVGLNSARRLIASAGVFAETGIAANLLYNRRITASTGGVSESGIDAGLLAARKLLSQPGQFILVGIDADLIKTGGNVNLVASTGVFSVNGATIGIYEAHRLDASTGAFNVAGSAASFLRGKRFTVDTGVFSVNGITIGILEAHRLVASTGAISVSGAANLLAARRLGLSPGSFGVNGINIGLYEAYTLLASAGSFEVSSGAASLLAYRRLAAGSGLIVIDGQALEYLPGGGIFVKSPTRVVLEASRLLVLLEASRVAVTLDPSSTTADLTQ